MEGGGGWRDGELWRPTGQREAGAACGLSPSSFQVEKPVCGPPREPPPGSDMKRWQIFVLWVFWMLILWLMTPYLDLTPESALQEKRMYLVLWRCNCPWFSLGKCGCPSETLNCSSCGYTAHKWNWLDACSRKTTGYLAGLHPWQRHRPIPRGFQVGAGERAGTGGPGLPHSSISVCSPSQDEAGPKSRALR